MVSGSYLPCLFHINTQPVKFLPEFRYVIMKNDSLHACIESRLNVGCHVVDKNALLRCDVELLQSAPVELRLRLYEAVAAAL